MSHFRYQPPAPRASAADQPPPAWQSALDQILEQLTEIRQLLSRTGKAQFTVAEVASWTGRSEYTVRRWIAEGRVRADRVAGDGPKGRLLIPRAELARLVGRGLAGGMPEALGGAADGNG